MFRNIFKKGSMNVEEIRKLEKSQEQIDFLQSMQKLDIKDGDIIVLHHPGKLSKVDIDALKSTVQVMIKEYGFNTHVMVFEEGVKIGVLRK